MEKTLKKIIVLLCSVLCCWMYWIIIYIGLDYITFEMSTSIRGLGSYKAVYDMFLISIVVSLLIAQTLIFIQYTLLLKSKNTRVIISSIQLVVTVLFIYLISSTEAVIPLIKNWHISIF